MNKLFTLFFAVAILFTACRGRDGEIGPQGPRGVDGRDGIDGVDGVDGVDGADGVIGYVEDYTVSSFNSTNDFYANFALPSTLQLLENDVIMAYIKTGEDNGREIWEPLPRTIFFSDGSILLYTFDYTYEDVSFLLDGNFDLSTLTATYTDNLVFRIAIIPTEYASTIDINNHQEVMETLGYKF